MSQESLQKRLNSYQKDIENIKKEFAKVVVGQEEILRKILMALICKGHVLIEGVPGIAKTLIVKTLAKTINCQFSRIQFTPDMLPSDITGVESYDEINKFYAIKGPVFANFILADEINRASPKVQSALLEAMQEKQVTIVKETYMLPNPFFVIATQNPIESVGVYTLPEAQVDRFLFKLKMTYPNKDDEEKILRQNMSTRNFEDYDIKPVVQQTKILMIQKDLENIYVNPKLAKYIISIIDATRNPAKYHIDSGKYIEYGSSPRAAIGIFVASKANALVLNKTFVTPDDIKKVAFDVLEHRLIPTYEAQSEGVKTETIIKEILRKIPIP